MTRGASIILFMAAIWAATRSEYTPTWRAHGWSDYMDNVLDSEWDPADPDNLSWYTVAVGGLYHTNDLGRTWRRTGDDGLDNLMLTNVAVARDAPHILYVTTGYARFQDDFLPPRAGNGIYRSDDHGATWNRLPMALATEDLRFLTSVVTSALGDTIVVASTRSIMRSVDHGQSWSLVADLPDVPHFQGRRYGAEYTDLYSHPRNLGTVISVTRSDNRNVFHGLISMDGGEHWQDLIINGRTIRNMTEYPVSPSWQFAFPPSTDSVVWARYYDYFYRSTDHGATWRSVAVHDPDEEVQWTNGLAAHPFSADTLLLAGSGTVARHTDGVLIAISASGSHHSAVNTVLPARDTYWGYRYVRTSHGTQEASWRKTARTASSTFGGGFNNAQVRDVCKLPTTSAGGEFRYVAAAYNMGEMVASSSPRVREDGWSSTLDAGSAQRRGNYHGTSHVLCHPEKPNHPISIKDGHLRLTGGRAPTQPESWKWWERYTPGRRSIGGISFIDMVPEYPDRVFTLHGGLRKSDDFGQTWRVLDTPGGVHFVHISRADPQLILAGGILSRDGGETWETSYDINPDTRERVQTGQFSYETVSEWLEIATHPSSTSLVWTCTPLELRLWDIDARSNTVLAAAADIGRCHDILVMPSDPAWLWAGTDRGLWESTDAGRTWTQQSHGLPSVPVTSFDVRDGQVIVGTYGRGVFSLPQVEIEALRTSSERSIPLPDRNAFALTPNWPNPFSRATTIGFTTAQAAPVRIEVYDVTGRKVSVLTDRIYAPGRHNVDWQAGPQSSGVYFVRMLADGRQVDTKRMVLRK